MLLTEKDEGSAYYMVRNLTFPEMEDQDMQCRYHHWDSCKQKRMKILMTQNTYPVAVNLLAKQCKHITFSLCTPKHCFMSWDIQQIWENTFM